MQSYDKRIDEVLNKNENDERMAIAHLLGQVDELKRQKEELERAIINAIETVKEC